MNMKRMCTDVPPPFHHRPTHIHVYLFSIKIRAVIVPENVAYNVIAMGIALLVCRVFRFVLTPLLHYFQSSGCDDVSN